MIEETTADSPLNAGISDKTDAAGLVHQLGAIDMEHPCLAEGAVDQEASCEDEDGNLDDYPERCTTPVPGAGGETDEPPLPDNTRPLVYLPSWRYGLEQTGRKIYAAFKNRETMFLRDRQIVEVGRGTNGDFKVVQVTPSALRSRLETLGEVVAYRADNNGRWAWRP